MESSVRSFRSSSSLRIAAAVNCFVTEPREKTVSDVFSIPCSRTARP
jgi:hypothetical protein